jgi:two-component sensor histidine kinase
MTEIHFEKKIPKGSNINLFLSRKSRHLFNNNLQIIANLIENNIHKYCNGNSHQIEDIDSKIQTIALWHNSINLLNENFEYNLEAYFSELCRNITHSYSSNIPIIRFDISAKEILFNTTTIQPLSLILNELIIHSLRINQELLRDLTISISVECIKKRRYKLKYYDDGENSYELNNHEKEIVQIFIDQLNGHLINTYR